MSIQHIGHYEIKAELGRGGMGTVYRASDPRFKRDVALKVLPREFLHDPTFRARFEREAQTIAALEHPAIVPVYDFGEDAGQPYLVMRYMPGGSLLDRLKAGPLPLDDVTPVVRRLAAALDAAHARGMVHRDLKPGNVLFDQWGEAYLSDFGIVKLTEGSAAYTGTVLIGTPEYISPEQARADKDLDGRSDVYSLGVVVFQLLTGRLPFKANTPMGMAMAHLTDPVPDILVVKSDLPPGAQTLIHRAMAKDREARYPTAGELAGEVSRLAAGGRVESPRPVVEPTIIEPPAPPPAPQGPTGTTTTPMPPPTAVRPRPARSWIAIGAVGVFACALLALGGVFIVPGLLNRATATPPPFPRLSPTWSSSPRANS